MHLGREHRRWAVPLSFGDALLKCGITDRNVFFRDHRWVVAGLAFFGSRLLLFLLMLGCIELLLKYGKPFTVVQYNDLFHFCIAAAEALLERFCVGLQEMYNIHPVDLGEAFNEDSICGMLPIPLQPVLQQCMALVLKGVGVLNSNLVDLLLSEIQFSC